MDMIPRNDYGEQCQFDAYCKLVLYHEAIDYLREMQRRRDRELSFSDLPQMEMDKLCVVDHYPSDRFTFSSHGYDLHIENELVADAFAGLSVQEQSILILHFVLDLLDQEVGRTHADGRFLGYFEAGNVLWQEVHLKRRPDYCC